MKTGILALTLFSITGAGIALASMDPPLRLAAVQLPKGPPVVRHAEVPAQKKVEVVFVLDTTGSMGGLIQAAKEKIWSIATTLASAQQQPEVRIGVVAYRDRGDAYVTRVVDLSEDLDSVYATLMDLQAAVATARRASTRPCTTRYTESHGPRTRTPTRRCSWSGMRRRTWTTRTMSPIPRRCRRRPPAASW